LGELAVRQHFRKIVLCVLSLAIVAVGIVNADSASANLAGGKTYGDCSGFRFIGTHSVGSVATLEVFWNGSSQQNCLILRRNNPSKSTTANLVVSARGTGSWVTDAGNYHRYAGAIRVKAPGCLRINAQAGRSTYSNGPGSGRFGC
jgi:hypothetical protein